MGTRGKHHVQWIGLGLTAMLGLSACDTEETVVPITLREDFKAEEIAQEIRSTYEDPLFEITSRNESHFAIRLYRATGDTSNFAAITDDVNKRARGFLELVECLHSPARMNEISTVALNSKSTRTEVDRQRRGIFAVRKEYLFNLRLLFAARKIQEHGLHQGALRKPYEKACNHLRRVDFRSFLLDPDVMCAYAAQAANVVHWLKQLEIADLEDEYTAAFQSIIMAQNDETITAPEYQNKLYGLTHFIIGDSRYYQRLVSPEKHRWILDYFDQNIVEILSWAKPDIVAEIGLCFRLCGLHDHRVVHLVRGHLARSFDRDLGIIPADGLELDFDSSEHRNAVAYLVLYPWDQLREGPLVPESSLHLR